MGELLRYGTDHAGCLPEATGVLVNIADAVGPVFRCRPRRPRTEAQR